MYKIYHIPGVKIGCTKHLTRRMREQGFTEYAVLEQHNDINVASIREKELQEEYGLIEKYSKIDYKTSVLNASKTTSKFKNGHTPWNIGVSHSELTKQKISLANSGRKQSAEEKQKRRIAADSNKSAEYKKAQSERIKEWWRLRKLNLI